MSLDYIHGDYTGILNTTPPYNLFGLEVQDYDKARVAVIPVPYDSTTIYRTGTREGPRAIIEASRMIEYYGEETGTDISRIGVYTTEEMAPDLSSPEKMVKRVEKEARLIVEDGKMPLLIGGEHTISIGGARACAPPDGNEFTFLHFDAHADSRESFFGAKYCHACVVARINEAYKSYSVGIRSIDEESARKNGKRILYMKDMRAMKAEEIASSIIENTSKSVYLSVDLDVLDPSEMPSVGTRSPTECVSTSSMR